MMILTVVAAGLVLCTSAAHWQRNLVDMQRMNFISQNEAMKASMLRLEEDCLPITMNYWQWDSVTYEAAQSLAKNLGNPNRAGVCFWDGRTLQLSYEEEREGLRMGHTFSWDGVTSRKVFRQLEGRVDYEEFAPGAEVIGKAPPSSITADTPVHFGFAHYYNSWTDTMRQYCIDSAIVGTAEHLGRKCYRVRFAYGLSEDTKWVPTEILLDIDGTGLVLATTVFKSKGNVAIEGSVQDFFNASSEDIGARWKPLAAWETLRLSRIDGVLVPTAGVRYSNGRRNTFGCRLTIVDPASVILGSAPPKLDWTVSPGSAMWDAVRGERYRAGENAERLSEADFMFWMGVDQLLEHRERKMGVSRPNQLPFRRLDSGTRSCGQLAVMLQGEYWNMGSVINAGHSAVGSSDALIDLQRSLRELGLHTLAVEATPDALSKWDHPVIVHSSSRTPQNKHGNAVADHEQEAQGHFAIAVFDATKDGKKITIRYLSPPGRMHAVDRDAFEGSFWSGIALLVSPEMEALEKFRDESARADENWNSVVAAAGLGGLGAISWLAWRGRRRAGKWKRGRRDPETVAGTLVVLFLVGMFGGGCGLEGVPAGDGMEFKEGSGEYWLQDSEGLVQYVGVVSPGKGFSWTYTLTNHRGEAVRIFRHSASCGCTSVKYANAWIAPGAAEQVEVEVRPNTGLGFASATVQLMVRGQASNDESLVQLRLDYDVERHYTAWVEPPLLLPLDLDGTRTRTIQVYLKPESHLAITPGRIAMESPGSMDCEACALNISWNDGGRFEWNEAAYAWIAEGSAEVPVDSGKCDDVDAVHRMRLSVVSADGTSIDVGSLRCAWVVSAERTQTNSASVRGK